MFGIDPISHYDFESIPEEMRCLIKLYSEILRRAILDLQYYQTVKDNPGKIGVSAYIHARSAQAWLDDPQIDSAVKLYQVLEILGIDKSCIDKYIESNGLRFIPKEEHYRRARRSADEIRFGKIRRRVRSLPNVRFN